MGEILVSICCITYNHEKYIEDALDSFLMQETNFKYEILVHDDASTDKTADIIREYEHRYPDLIKPIYQTENQYSKGVKVGQFNRRRAQGKYIALCEGDDYWIDSLKLQKQVNYMSTNPECLMCVHAAYKVDVNKKTVGQIRPYNQNKIVIPKDIIMTSGNFIPTASYFYKVDNLKDRPYFCQISPVGDYALNLLCVSRGSIYYVDEFMSAYRVNVPGSILYMMNRSSDKEKVASRRQRIRMLEEFNKFSNYRYSVYIKEKVRNIQFDIHCIQGDLAIIKSLYKDKYDSLGLRLKISMYIKIYLPKMHNFIKNIRMNL